VGFYRHAAATFLNETENVGVVCPIVIVEHENDLARLLQQISENVDRTNFSVMDRAVAMKRLLDAGLPRKEVLKVFAVPGGRKGIRMQPLSNSSLNIHLSFFRFPKSIQARLHDGRMTQEAGRALLEKPESEWESRVADIELARLKEIDEQEQAEDKFAENQEKKKEQNDKKQELLDKVKQAEKEVDAIREQSQAHLALQADLLKQTTEAISATERKEAEKNLHAAQKVQKEIQRALENKLKKAEAAKMKADTAIAKTVNKDKAAVKTAKPISSKEINSGKPAAKKSAPIIDNTGVEPLTFTQVKNLLVLMKSKENPPVVQYVSGVLIKTIEGLYGPRQCIKMISTAISTGVVPKAN
jgi:enoyl reductase-like protein